ncbi:RluA family pseudouridine synthase [Flavobacterium macrobrachii]|uniref:RNA pseudouridine synthase n=1 Tax=Flavobacterium macrobrachii TaxID=591204 RepID=A0ABS2D0F8_9FLAO|nr:RluA family pseudouridine synthase [Flavobacterium macrobrachii]MBM6500324.1 RNA pseudouridine synthase [Flavobacterium macrobrachii]
MIDLCFHSFQTNISTIPLPEKFTFPFYYEPHELSSIAANELQNYLETQTDFEHNFGLDEKQKGLEIGKMFGVLIVQNQNGELGHLWAFSGKLAESNHHPKFVPTVYDMLDDNGYFKKEEVILNLYNAEIEALEQNQNFLSAIQHLEQTKLQAEKEITTQKEKIKLGKKLRAEKRKTATPSKIEQFNKESQDEGILLKKMTQYWNYKLEDAKQNLVQFTNKINQLKEERKEKSAALQQQLFTEYAFLNKDKQLKSLAEIFNGNPPAGSGECAAPKLLHYAFQHNLKPICMAEFWWGKSPKSEVRKHQQFYPACMGKCEPILKHMLNGIETDKNPFEINPADGKELEIVFEDEHIIAVNKPAEFLSVPGKQITDSVQTRIQSKYPNAMIVHRLDMSTSGIILIGKNFESYKNLQAQFIKRKVKKRYVALLDGILTAKEGIIELPLRVDLDNRPNQIVCFEHGKPAKTEWKTIEIRNNQTLVHFYPITGRTHQLRVHAAHYLGLNCPIVGDDLYGTKANRLHLHAESITFKHPFSKEEMTISIETDF